METVSLRAGVQGVQAFYAGLDRSNVVPVVLRPAVRKTGEEWGVTYDTDDKAVTVNMTGTIGKAQRAALYLNELPSDVPEAKRTAYTLSARSRSEDGDTLTFPLEAPAALKYLVRVEVDGAESTFARDADTGRFTGPVLDLSGT